MSKQCFETRIAEAENGVVVRIGCKVFVGTVDELTDVVQYYQHKLPEHFKENISKNGTFTIYEESDFVHEPKFNIINSWIRGKYLKLLKVINGWIISSGNKMWIVRDEDEQEVLIETINVALQNKIDKCTNHKIKNTTYSSSATYYLNEEYDNGDTPIHEEFMNYPDTKDVWVSCFTD